MVTPKVWVASQTFNDEGLFSAMMESLVLDGWPRKPGPSMGAVRHEARCDSRRKLVLEGHDVVCIGWLDPNYG